MLVLLEMIIIMYLELQIRVPYQFMTKMQVSEFDCFLCLYKSIIYLVLYVELMSKCIYLFSYRPIGTELSGCRVDAFWVMLSTIGNVHQCYFYINLCGHFFLQSLQHTGST